MRLRIKIGYLLLSVYSSFMGNAQTINTIAGNGIATNTGDGGPAIAASVYIPVGSIFDKYGNFYFALGTANVVRKISSDGIISTVAGTGIAGYSGDGALAINAELNNPSTLALDSIGNLYIADPFNQRIRKIDMATGVITTFAGNGVAGYSGDGGQAVSAMLNHPHGISMDRSGNLYIADALNIRIRKVTPNGIISTIAGTGINGYSGDGGLADTSQLGSPFTVCNDDTGNLYIADLTGRIRKVDFNGVISTYAGNGVIGYSGDGGLATNAQINTEFICWDKFGNLYTTEGTGDKVRKIDNSGIITTIIGNGVEGYSGDGGDAVYATVNHPQGLAVDSCGNLFISDSYNYRIRKVEYFSSCSLNIKPVFPVNVNIYPNPTTNKLAINSQSKVKSIVIINSIGQTVLSQSIDKKQAELNIGHLQAGVYFLTVTDANGAKLTRKIIKE